MASCGRGAGVHCHGCLSGTSKAYSTPELENDYPPGAPMGLSKRPCICGLSLIQLGLVEIKHSTSAPFCPDLVCYRLEHVNGLLGWNGMVLHRENGETEAIDCREMNSQLEPARDRTHE